MALKCQKKLFRLEDNQHYINCAYMSPLMRSVEMVGHEELRKSTRPYEYSVQDFFKPVQRLKKAFAKLIDAPDPDRMAIIPSVSYGIATVAANLDLEPDQNIVIVGEQFPSNVYSWKRLCSEKGAELRVVAPPKKRAEWSVKVAMAIDENTRAVALGHVHWADGTRFALKGIADKARLMGALVIIDGTQSIGALHFPFEDIKPDAVFCAGYKWLMGPYSLGLGYYGPWFDDKLPIEDNWITRKNSNDFQQLVNYEDEYRSKAFRYSVGETSNFLLVPMLLASIKQVNSWGPSQIQKYCRKLTQPFISEWTEMGYKITAEEHRAAHLFGIRVPDDTDAKLIKPILKRRKVNVSFRGNAIRVSPHVYNDKDDMVALTEVLKEYASIHKSVMA